MKLRLCYLLLAVTILSNCVSKKTYIASLSQAKINDSLLRDTLRQKDFVINKLSTYIQNMSTNGEIPAENFLPIIPNPPPLCTDYIAFDEKKFSKFKTYRQVDSVLSEAILKTYKTKVYMAFKDGGFAIATPVVMNNDKSENHVKLASNDNLLSFFKYLFSQMHEEELFFPDVNYSKCVIFIISPNLYAIGGKNKSGNEIQNWINENNFRLPEQIRNIPLPKNTQVVALLYEFEENKNLRGQLKVLDSKHKITELENLDLIKYLSKYKL